MVQFWYQPWQHESCQEQEQKHLHPHRHQTRHISQQYQTHILYNPMFRGRRKTKTK
jgi:hypothetical protein